MQKTCTTCRWNQQQMCENTNWKTGKLITTNTVPVCGFLTSLSKTPIGYNPRITEISVKGMQK